MKSLNIKQFFEDLFNKIEVEPSCITDADGLKIYTIPSNFKHKATYDRKATSFFILEGTVFLLQNELTERKFMFHREDGPALEYLNNNEDSFYFYYNTLAKNEEQFYNKRWRRKIETKVFL